MIAEQTHTEQATTTKRANAIYWAVVLVWAGLVFGADSLGALPQIGQSDAWNWVFFGAGIFSLLGNLYLDTSGETRPRLWNYVWAAVLIIIGLGGLTSIEISFPLILVLIGLALLATALLPTAPLRR